MTTDQRLSAAIVAFVWAPGAAIPGRHPEAVADKALRARVESIVAEVDAVRPDVGSEQLLPWADAQVRQIAAGCPGLSHEAAAALRSLLTWQWH